MAAALLCLAAGITVAALQFMGWRVPPWVPLILMVASAIVVGVSIAGIT